MDKRILEEKMDLLRWIINLNDEQVIKNLINFKNELFGVPFVDASPSCVSDTKTPVSIGGKKLSPNHLKFEVKLDENFLRDFEEALSVEEAKEQSIKKIQAWWRD